MFIFYLNIFGRIEVGHQYETQIHNFFFGSAEEELTACVNRLLDEDDLKQLAEQKKQASREQQNQKVLGDQAKTEDTEEAEETSETSVDQ